MRKKYVRGILLTLVGGICWGFSGACGQLLVANPNITTEQITALRMIFAGIILVLISIISRKKAAFEVFKKRGDLLRLCVFSVFGILLSQLTYIKAISYSNAGTATILQYLGPVIIMLYTCIKNRRFPEKKEVMAVFLAFFGVVVIATHFNLARLNISGKCLFWGLASAVGLAFYSILPANLIKKYGAVPISGFAMLLGGIVLGAMPGVFGGGAEFNGQIIFALAGMIIVGTVIAYTLYLQGTSDIGAVRASMIACVEPVSATLFSCFWLGTAFEYVDIIGFVMVLSTVFILSIGKKNGG